MKYWYTNTSDRRKKFRCTNLRVFRLYFVFTMHATDFLLDREDYKTIQTKRYI